MTESGRMLYAVARQRALGWAKDLRFRRQAAAESTLGGLPKELLDWFELFGPDDVKMDFGEHSLPALASLAVYQLDFRLTNSDWIVFADQGNNPYIFDAGSGRVMFAVHGSGEWSPVELGCSMAELALILATEAAAHAYLPAATESNLRDLLTGGEAAPWMDGLDDFDWHVIAHEAHVFGATHGLVEAGTVSRVFTRREFVHRAPAAWYVPRHRHAMAHSSSFRDWVDGR